MANTKEQQDIIDTAVKLFNKDNSELLKIEAVAGSGKTHTLVQLAKAINPSSGLYLAYNKAIATESESKFKNLNVRCQTIHSLAYRATVNQYGLKVGASLKPRDIKGGFDYDEALLIVNTIEDFCLSKYTTFETYEQNIIEELPTYIIDKINDQLHLIASG
jgi:superfamily I DNA/RNA helicase